MGFASPDPDTLDSMLGYSSAPSDVTAALNLSTSTQWIANTRVGAVWIDHAPYVWQVGDGNPLVSERSEGWQMGLAKNVADRLAAQGWWGMPGDPPVPVPPAVFHPETGFADVHIFTYGHVAVDPDGLVYILTPAEWAAPTSDARPVPPLLADQWHLSSVQAAGLEATDRHFYGWNIIGFGTAQLSATFLGPPTLDGQLVMASVCGTARITETSSLLEDGSALTALECENDGYLWDLIVAPYGLTEQSILSMQRPGDLLWPYIGWTGPTLGA